MNEGKSSLHDYVSSFSSFRSRAKHSLQFCFVYNLLTKNNEKSKSNPSKTSLSVAETIMIIIMIN